MCGHDKEAPRGETSFSKVVKMMEKAVGDSRAERGSTLFEEGDYEAAREEFIAALRIYRETEFPPGESKMLSLLALCSFALDEYGPSLGFLAQSVRIKGEIGDLEGGATDLMAIGRVRLVMGDADAAIESLNDARDLFERLEMHAERKQVEELIRQAERMREAS